MQTCNIAESPKPVRQCRRSSRRFCPRAERRPTNHTNQRISLSLRTISLSTIAPANAETAAESTPHNGKPLIAARQSLLVIYGLMAGMCLASLDQTIVGTAIRTIGDDLHGLNDQAWVTTAYLITST